MLTVEPRRARNLLLATAGAMGVMTAISQAAGYWAPNSTTANGLSFFDAVREGSIPTLLTTLLLLACAALAALIARSARGESRWMLLAIILLALAIDEAVQLHEATVLPLRR